MKRFLCFIVCACALCACAILSSCKGGVDYFGYVSELRHGVYFYGEDGMSVKIYCSDRETPYLSDGIKGDVNGIIEIFVKLDDVPEEVSVSVGGYGGDMNYRSVTRSFYLSFSGEDFNCGEVAVTLEIDGKEREIIAENVRYAGVIDERTALKCVTEYDAKLFERLTDGSHFKGEIYIRLLYDGGCFYYVGVCDREGKINAYLLDGEDGRVIATKEIKQ